VTRLTTALQSGELVVTTGLVLQELLQGFSGPRNHQDIVERFLVLPFVWPDRRDHIEAAALRYRCRRAGVRVGSIDALLAELCLRHDLTMLTSDRDFHHMSAHRELSLWRQRAFSDLKFAPRPIQPTSELQIQHTGSAVDIRAEKPAGASAWLSYA
jgi:predicted nucleic acid-binding protein